MRPRACQRLGRKSGLGALLVQSHSLLRAKSSGSMDVILSRKCWGAGLWSGLAVAPSG